MFGGNLDCKEPVAGTTLYLPVYQRGALFYTGDSHAAQGDGEVTVNAIETANTAVFQLILHKDRTLLAPRAETPTHYIAFGLDPDLDNAMTMAIKETNASCFAVVRRHGCGAHWSEALACGPVNR